MTEIGLKIILEAVKLTKGFDRNFLDYELANGLSISKAELHEYLQNPIIEPLFRKTKIKYKCPECGRETEKFQNIDPVCKNCGYGFDDANIGDYQLNLLKEQSKNFFLGQVISYFENGGYDLKKREKSIISLSRNETRIFVMISLQNLSIDEFFLVRGSIKPTPFDFYIFIGFSADSEFVMLANQDPHCIVLPIFDFENDDFFAKLSQSIENRKSTISENFEAEKNTGFEFEDYTELRYAKARIVEIFDNLPFLALQQSEGSISYQGKRFQKDVVDLLNFTLFSARHLGGNNEPDGLIQLFSTGKIPIWIPVEVKTFKPIDGKFLNIKEISGQLSKYSTALEKDDISTRIQAPAFLIIAYDFEFDAEQIEIINELERNHRIKYSFMPLNVLIHLVKLYIDTQVSIISNDLLKDLFIQNRLLSKEIVDELFKKIKRADQIDAQLLKNFHEQVKKQGL